ncbi:YhgE/Pip family protein [Levilactobacillus parabrevis]|uniref:YhgE/Pip family protein n=2 Tax=Levilactobacillus parabrevis TaxID=357278 RepID=UPI0035D470FA|nr:YhgE/Pip domain-containing protein [Levilactobacillus parabrevis]MCT4489687.1 YhgE/Pip domain-containing protein [Levilactobacillus parabrevis]
MNMIKGEWNYIRHNRLILISVLAIMFIPFLYSIFFLKSVWDPYGETGELPVAVVNQDKPVTYQGQKLNVGDQTITNLKKNKQLGWKFVSAKTAADGLKHHKYYTVITIPKNFSANAATALNKNPKKMTFTYKTNGSANYIAQVMSEVGSSKLDSQIRAKVTKAYAQATFKQIYAVGQGMDKAAKGSAKLKDGTVTLTDGLNTYTTGVHTLNNGLQQMKTSVKPLATGIQKLSTGSQTLQTGLAKYTSGVGQYASGVNQFTGGVSQLSAKMPTMQAGANKLATGAKTLNTGTYKYVNGVYTLNSGLGKLTTKVGPLASGVTKLTKGSKSLTAGLKKLDNNSPALKSGANQLSSGMTEMQSVLNELAPGLALLTSLTSDSSKLTDLQSTLKALAESKQITQENVAGIEKDLGEIEKVQASLSDPASQTQVATIIKKAQSDIAVATPQEASDNSSEGSTVTEKETSVSGASSTEANANKTVSDTAELEKAIDDQDTSKANRLLKVVKADASNTADAAGSIEGSSTTKTSEAAGTRSADTTTAALIADVQGLLGVVNSMQTSLKTLQSTVNDLYVRTSSLQTVFEQAQAQPQGSQKDPAVLLTELSTAVTTLQNSSTAIQKLGSSSDSMKKLVSGSSQLSTGLDTYTAGVSSALTGSKTLTDGLTTLNNSVPALTVGVTELANGSKKLAKNGPSLKSGSKQLSAGASQLSSGINQAAAGVNKLNANTGKLTAAGNKLTSSSAQLMNGSGQLTSGLNTLNSKVPTLTSGVNQLAAGSKKLNDNSNQLMQGAKKLSDGNGTLAKSLKSGADQIKAQPLSSKTADMFAAPTNLKHESYSYVPNYGHALAPYVLSVALYVGALVFNFAFPIRKVSREGGTATGWFLSKASIGAVEGLAMGLIEPALMMLGGLSVDHPGQMILISVFFAEASMFIVMFLSMLLDNPGRFIAMVLLMLQLGGSGGTFPMEVTNHFYNVVHPFLPMTYSILGFRQAITSGMSGMVGQALWVLALFTILGLALLWPTMVWLQKKHLMGISQLDDNQKLQAVEDPNTNAHS